jgi:hypothetical protein
MGKNDSADKLAPANLPFIANELFAPHIHHFLQAQEKAFSKTDAFTRSWIERRQEATLTAMQTVRRFADEAPVDTGKAQSLLQELQMQSMKQVAEDANQWLALWSDCANVFAMGEIDAEAEVMEAARKGKGTRRLPTRIPV